MSQALYKVVLSGELHDEFDKDNVIDELSTLFKCPQSKAAVLVSGKPTKLKKEMPKDKAEKYCARLAKAGVKCSIESIAPPVETGLSLEVAATEEPEATSAAPAPTGGLSLEPAPQSEQPETGGLSLEAAPQESSESGGLSLEAAPQEQAETGGLSLEAAPQEQPESGGLSLEAAPQEQPESGGLSLEAAPQEQPESGGLSLEAAPQEAETGGLSLEAAPQEQPESGGLSLETAPQAEEPETGGLSMDAAPEQEQPEASGLSMDSTNDTGEGLGMESQPETDASAIAEEESTDLVCPKCHTKQPRADQCVKCGIYIEKFLARQAMETEQEQDDETDSPAAAEENEILDEFDEMALFVGDEFDEKYRMRFAELQDNNNEYVRDWDWITFLIPFPWMIYRKMYVPALICFVLYLITPFILWPIMHVVSGLGGTYLYYRYVNYYLGKIDVPEEERRGAIEKQGGVMAVPLVFGVVLASSLLYWLVVFFIFVGPQFADEIAEVQKEVTAVQNEMQSDIRGMHQSVNEAQALQVAMVKQAINMNVKLMKSISKEDVALPETGEELLEKFQLPPELLTDSWNNKIVYERTKTGYSLRSMGPDGKFLTDDDILVHATLD